MNWAFWSSSIAALTWLGISVFQAGNRFRRLHSSRPVTWLAHTDQSQVWAPLQYMHGHTFSPKYQLRAAQQCRHHFILIFLLQDWGTRTQTCLFLLKKKKREGSTIKSKPEIRGKPKNSRKELPASKRRWEHRLCFGGRKRTYQHPLLLPCTQWSRVNAAMTVPFQSSKAKDVSCGPSLAVEELPCLVGYLQGQSCNELVRVPWLIPSTSWGSLRVSDSHVLGIYHFTSKNNSSGLCAGRGEGGWVLHFQK